MVSYTDNYKCSYSYMRFLTRCFKVEIDCSKDLEFSVGTVAILISFLMSSAYFSIFSIVYAIHTLYYIIAIRIQSRVSRPFALSPCLDLTTTAQHARKGSWPRETIIIYMLCIPCVVSYICSIVYSLGLVDVKSINQINLIKAGACHNRLYSISSYHECIGYQYKLS